MSDSEIIWAPVFWNNTVNKYNTEHILRFCIYSFQTCVNDNTCLSRSPTLEIKTQCFFGLLQSFHKCMAHRLTSFALIYFQSENWLLNQIKKELMKWPKKMYCFVLINCIFSFFSEVLFFDKYCMTNKFCQLYSYLLFKNRLGAGRS